MAKIMNKSLSVLSLVLLCLVAIGISDDIDCSKIPIENLKPCEPFISGSSTMPSSECCKGANSWLTVQRKDVCKCYNKSPDRLPFKFNRNTTEALVPKCGLPDAFYLIACCISPGSACVL